MENAIDLLIQDFVSTNKLVNQCVGWEMMVARRFEDGRRKIFQYGQRLAVGEHVSMTDGEWFCISLVRPSELPEVEQLRFDCLKMMYAQTHYQMSVEAEGSVIIVKLLTKNRGLMNVMFRFVDSVVPWT